MSDFINTIDVLGDDTVIDSLIDMSITELKDDEITTIGSYAFYGNKNLLTIDFPNVTTISGFAFYGCTSLTDVGIPNITAINAQAFRNCTSLLHISLPKWVSPHIASENVFYGCANLSSVDIPNTTVLPSGTFRSCSALKILRLPVKNIYSSVFDGSGIQALILLNNDSICTLGNTNSFNGTPIASGTGYVYVPSALVNSYRTATNWSTYSNQFRGIFDNEDILQGIIDNTLVNLQDNEIESIPVRGCYNYQPIESVSSTSVTRVGESAFENCTSLESIDLPNVEYLDPRSFNGCVSLKKVVFPNTIRNLHERAFSDCTSLEIADFRDARFTSASAYQFQNCSSLKAYINRSTDFCEQAPHGYIFRNSTISDINGEGYIYVPRNMIDLYINNGWSGAAPDKKWRALENYTTDGTTTGEMREYTESVSLNVSELTFNDTNRQKLILTGKHGMFDKNIWESSNPSVASVYNGMVRPNSDGTAIITITSGNHSATCSVTVNIGQELANILNGVIFNKGNLSGVDGSHQLNSENDVCTDKFDISNYIGSEIEVQLLDVRSNSTTSRICFYRADNKLVGVLSGNKVDYGVVITGVIPRDAVYAGISINKSSGFSGINIICEDATIGTTTYTS